MAITMIIIINMKMQMNITITNNNNENKDKTHIKHDNTNKTENLKNSYNLKIKTNTTR